MQYDLSPKQNKNQLIDQSEYFTIERVTILQGNRIILFTVETHELERHGYKFRKYKLIFKGFPTIFLNKLQMLIQLQIENLIKQIEFSSSIRTKSQESVLSTRCSTYSSDQESDSSSSILQRTRAHISTHHKRAKNLVEFCSTTNCKIKKICSDTFMSDKIVRMISSIIKVIRTFNLIKNVKQLQQLYIQIIQLRRLLRFNRIFSYLNEIKGILMKSNKKWLDYYNIIFKNILFVLDIIDTLGYAQQVKLLSKFTISPSFIKKNTSNLYFIECLMWLYLNSYDYVKNRSQRTRKDNLKKELAILKYVLDSITSHNQFSRRITTLSPKTITAIGTISSAVGLYAIWI